MRSIRYYWHWTILWILVKYGKLVLWWLDRKRKT